VGSEAEAQFSNSVWGVECLPNCSVVVTDPGTERVLSITPAASPPGEGLESRLSLLPTAIALHGLCFEQSFYSEAGNSGKFWLGFCGGLTAAATGFAIIWMVSSLALLAFRRVDYGLGQLAHRMSQEERVRAGIEPWLAGACRFICDRLPVVEHGTWSRCCRLDGITHSMLRTG
jgi:hypothetical protein